MSWGFGLFGWRVLDVLLSLLVVLCGIVVVSCVGEGRAGSLVTGGRSCTPHSRL